MAHRLRSVIVATDLRIYAAAAAVTALLTTLALELWKTDLRVPLTYRGDALPVSAHFKTVFEEGWYEYQPRLGAPFGQTYNDFPTADNFHLIVAKVMRIFTSDWALALNLYFLLGFVVIALAAVWVLRLCAISPWLSVALAAVYSIAPYHFLRGESHLFLASYYCVPLAIGLLVIVIRGGTIWGLNPLRTGLLRIVLSPTVRTLVIAGVLGTSSSYYSVFFLALLAPAGILTLVRDRDWKKFWGATGAGVAVVIVMVANMLPDVLFSLTHGQNPLGLERAHGEAETYALKLSQLLFPWVGHRIAFLAELRRQYDTGYVPLGENPALGAIGAAGLVAAMLVIGYLGFARMRGSRATVMPEGRFELVAGLSGLVFVAFIFSTIGGLSTIISIFTSSLRGWNRMSIVIAMLCLAIVGLLIDMVIDRRADRRDWSALRRGVVAGVVALALIAVAFVDQTPGDSAAEYAGNAQGFAADKAYFGEIQESLPANSMVLVVPYIPFPESNAPTGLLASDQLIPYLQSSTIRWSNGGIKGRPTADWSGELQQYGDQNLATLAAAAGFSGVLVDRRAALDGGASLDSALRYSTGDNGLADPSGRFGYYDLSSVATRLHAAHNDTWFDDAAAAITNPVIAYRSPGFGNDAADIGGISTSNNSGQFTLVNNAGSERTIELSFTALPRNPAGTIVVTLPDGSVISKELTAEGTTVTSTIDVPPGSSLVGITMTDALGQPYQQIGVTQPRARNLDISEIVDASG